MHPTLRTIPIMSLAADSPAKALNILGGRMGVALALHVGRVWVAMDWPTTSLLPGYYLVTTSSLPCYFLVIHGNPFREAPPNGGWFTTCRKWYNVPVFNPGPSGSVASRRDALEIW